MKPDLVCISESVGQLNTTKDITMKRKRSANLKRTLQYNNEVEESENSSRGKQVHLEVENNVGMMGNSFPNGLSQMIVSIISEISKESGGLANLSRSLAGNSISNGQMRQPQCNLSNGLATNSVSNRHMGQPQCNLSNGLAANSVSNRHMGQPQCNLSNGLAANSVSNRHMGQPQCNLSRSLAGNSVNNRQMGQPHGNLSRSLAGISVSKGQMGQQHVSTGIEENESRPYQSSEYNDEELDAALAVIKKTMELDASDSFNRPVDPIALDLPDYFDVIKTPMDFGTICNNLENGLKYINSADVLKDVQYIWDNCLKYNKKGDHILGLMRRVKAFFMKHWKAAGLQMEKSPENVESSSLKHNKRKNDNPSTPVASNFLHSQQKDAGSHQVAEKRPGPVNMQSGPPQQSSSLSESSPEKDEDSTYTEKKHKVQRPTHYHKLSSTMGQIKVFTNEMGQPVGPEAFQLTKFLGHIARDGNLAPLSFSGWSKMPEEIKENLWQKVLTRFAIDPSCRSWVLMSLESKWKSFRSWLKTTRYDTHATDEERLADRDQRVLPEQWSVLVSHWSSDKFQNISAKNKANRAKVRFHHTLGAKSYARKIEEERAKRPNGQELSPAELFILTRTCKNGQAVNEATNAVISQLHESSTQDEAYFRVMGEDRKGGVSLSGLNATPKSEISTRAEALRMAKENNEEIDAIKDRLASLEKTCSGMATQMSAMMSMMATMLKGSHGEAPPNAVVPTLLPEAPEPASRSNHEVLGRQTRGSKKRR